MIDLSKIKTEKENPNSVNFSEMSIEESVKLMNTEDINAVKCIESQYSEIAKLIEKTGEALKQGGRIIYMGAGTSGRLGVLDAVECPPTFGVDYETVVGLIAGGENAFVKAKEGAEDNPTFGEEDLKKINLSPKDVVIGIAASGRTPYVIGGLKYANEIGAITGSIACTDGSEIGKISRFPIEVIPGPEVLTGSTRLKAGTATKLILNMISTISMKMVGKVYKNYMVDLKLSNKKLQVRGVNIVRAVTGVGEEIATEKLIEANGHVKLAIVMIILNIGKEEAEQILENAKGNIQNIKRGEKYE
ncbi:MULTISPECIES: N-acetylmuramic acid 6-phosphate etherase [Helcococcus]|uniref:N-acetylmuramic acid 6-phosphate etherase n=1 Tax=Helcococcus bovis TaxID=3153252 RepID=A0ABW9F5S6_9FIRM